MRAELRGARLGRRDRPAGLRAGEELTVDYATTDTIGLRMACRCGAPTCRGVVSGDDWQDEGFRERNRDYLSAYIWRLVGAPG